MRRSNVVLSATLVLGVFLSPVRRAEACGGFFCGQTPVDQSGEHILFAHLEDGTVVAHIQIQYQGAAEDFAWVLPLAAEPEVSVGTNAIFPLLRRLTEPRFAVTWETEGVCARTNLRASYNPTTGEMVTDRPVGGATYFPDEVDVLSQGSVGPYDTAVIRSEDAQALLDWLYDNDYDVPDTALPQIHAYVNQGDVFLALRLQNERAVGDIVPIVVRFPEEGPCIPLRLTAIAATPDMPVYAFVLGRTGAVSTEDFLEVQINEAAVDWFSGGRNYRAVVTRAVDEADGRAFVREYAGTSSVLEDAFWEESRYDLGPLRDTTDPIAFVNAVLHSVALPLDGQLIGVLRQFIPMPPELAEQNLTEREFYGCLWCYRASLGEIPFDAPACAAAIEEAIVRPLREVQALAGAHPYLTRLFTTISPDEMSSDPLLRFNPDVPDVSNLHAASATRLCDERHTRDTAPVRLELPDGHVIILDSEDPGYPGSIDYTFRDDDGDGDSDNAGVAPSYMPAALRALRHRLEGPGELVLDNELAIDRSLASIYGRPHHAAGGACSAAPQDRGLGCVPLLLAVVVPAFLVGRRSSPVT